MPKHPDKSTHNKFAQHVDRVSRDHAAEAYRFREMADFGMKRAKLESDKKNYKKSSNWELWAYQKELDAEYHESRI